MHRKLEVLYKEPNTSLRLAFVLEAVDFLQRTTQAVITSRGKNGIREQSVTPVETPSQSRSRNLEAQLDLFALFRNLVILN